MNPDRPVLLVSDRAARAETLARDIGPAMAVRVVAYGARLPDAPPRAWIIDLDLDRGIATTWFEELCAHMQPGTPSLYLSRGASTRADAALALLGSPTVLSEKVHARALVSTLLRSMEPDAAPVRWTPVARRLGIATRFVTNVFAAAADGRAPDAAEADQGTEIVLEAISDIGIRAWLDLVWRHDITVYQHALSVAGYAAAFGTELGFSRSDRHRLAKAALLHDVGKARIPLAILNKPGPLTPDETATMRRHPEIGADLLAATGEFEQDVVDVARWHHERLDGSGYPDRLTGDAIGDLVRLVAICDVYPALPERGVSRPALGAREACAIMDGMVGQLDHDLMRVYRPVIANVEQAA